MSVAKTQVTRTDKSLILHLVTKEINEKLGHYLRPIQLYPLPLILL